MSISKRINAVELPSCTVYFLNSGHKGLVKFKFIQPGGEIFCQDNSEKAQAYTSMLDQGSKHFSKEKWALYLDSMGSSVGFASDFYRQFMGGRCLTDHFEKTTFAAIEQSQNPLLEESSWSVVQQRLIGHLNQMEDDTQSLAYIEMVRAFYKKGHPHYSLTIQQGISSIQNLSVEDLRSYHEKAALLSPLKLIVVGDFDQDYCNKFLENQLNNPLSQQVKYPKINDDVIVPDKKHYHIEVPEKSSIDVYWAHPIAINRHHEDYLPLMLGIYILGGNFSARLMRTVRDEEGLTYGVYSKLSGMNDHLKGFWYVHATFAPDLFDQGEKSILHQINLWHQKGVNAEEFENRKQGIMGKHLVGTSTTQGLMSSLTQIISQSLDLDYIDRYPQLIQSISLEEVNRCIQTYIDPDSLVRFSAGQKTSSA